MNAILRPVIMITALVLLALLAGCAGQRGGYAQEPYILNLNKGLLCIEGGRCQRMSLIVPSFQEDVVAAAYGMTTKKSYSWDSGALSYLMLNPPNDLYQVEQIGDRIFRLPPLFSTHAVWDVLAEEEWDLYKSYDDDDGHGTARPHPRRW
ncbi:MAG: hypothetical protein V7731_07045 [Amphritea sp.]